MKNYFLNNTTAYQTTNYEEADLELADTRAASLSSNLWKLPLLLLALAWFWFSLDSLSLSVSSLGRESLYAFIASNINPITGLFLGLLFTAIIQSSSTVTSALVALVASGIIDLATALPIVMGANLGTTLTSQIVAMGYLSRKKEFKRAFATANLHLFFNIITVLVLLPLEIYTGAISYISQAIGNLFVDVTSFSGRSASGFIGNWLSPVSSSFVAIFGDWTSVAFIVSAISLFSSLYFLSWLLRLVVGGNIQRNIYAHIFGSPANSMLWGTMITGLLQSSSLVTSTLVPLVAVHRTSVKKAFPFVVGANVGTTITAFIATLFRSEAAISIAIAHLLFNLIGALICLPHKGFRNYLVIRARHLAIFAEQNPATAVVYPLAIFFVLPLLIIYFSQL